MKYYRLRTTDPYRNLAIEEFLFRHTDDDAFLLWQNEPTVVIGKNQNLYAEVDLAYAAAEGIHLCRRITGGGAVYHDLNNLNFSFITSEEKAKVLDYAYFCEPILRALSELGLSCSLSGRNDLECEGRKFSGNAQHAEGGRILHHGTILFDTDVAVMSRVLRVDREKLEFRAVKSHAARVVNLRELLGDSFGVTDLISHIEGFVLRTMGAERAALPFSPELEALCQRNASEEWIFSNKRYLTSYALTRKKKYPFGLVMLAMEIDKDRIAKIRISGDFFGTAPIEELEARLVGQRLHALSPIDPSPYVAGMSFAELSALIGE